jgi:hypothetical protein
MVFWSSLPSARTRTVSQVRGDMTYHHEQSNLGHLDTKRSEEENVVGVH